MKSVLFVAPFSSRKKLSHPQMMAWRYVCNISCGVRCCSCVGMNLSFHTGSERPHLIRKRLHFSFAFSLAAACSAKLALNGNLSGFSVTAVLVGSVCRVEIKDEANVSDVCSQTVEASAGYAVHPVSYLVYRLAGL